MLLTTFLFTLGLPYKMLGVVSTGQITEVKKSLLWLRFSIPSKKIHYVEFLKQFELLYRDMVIDI